MHFIKKRFKIIEKCGIGVLVVEQKVEASSAHVKMLNVCVFLLSARVGVQLVRVVRRWHAWLDRPEPWTDTAWSRPCWREVDDKRPNQALLVWIPRNGLFSSRCFRLLAHIILLVKFIFQNKGTYTIKLLPRISQTLISFWTTCVDRKCAVASWLEKFLQGRSG